MRISNGFLTLLFVVIFSWQAVAADSDKKTANPATNTAQSDELLEAQKRIDRLESQISELQAMVGALESLVKQKVVKGVTQPIQPQNQRVSPQQSRIAPPPHSQPAASSPPRNQATVRPPSSNQPEFRTPNYRNDGWGASTQNDDTQFGTTTITPLPEPQSFQGPANDPATPRINNINLPQSDAARLYQAGYRHLENRDFRAAKQTFSSFLNVYGQDPLAGNAQYWLAEIHFTEGDYRSAANLFLQGYQKYRNNAKAPDNLLRLGMSLQRLGQNEAACSTYAQLLAKFPNVNQRIRSHYVTERQRAKCS